MLAVPAYSSYTAAMPELDGCWRHGDVGDDDDQQQLIASITLARQKSSARCKAAQSHAQQELEEYLTIEQCITDSVQEEKLLGNHHSKFNIRHSPPQALDSIHHDSTTPIDTSRREEVTTDFVFDDSHTWDELTMDDPSFMTIKSPFSTLAGGRNNRESPNSSHDLLQQPSLDDIDDNIVHEKSSNTNDEVPISVISRDRHHTHAQSSESDASSMLLQVPVSKLLQTYFPGLEVAERAASGRYTATRPKSIPKTPGVHTKSSPEVLNSHQDTNPATIAMQKEKFEKELANHRVEILKLRKQQFLNDQNAHRIQREKAEFEALQEAEVMRLEEESKKLRRERALFERNRKANELLPSKKDRQEMEEVRRQIDTLNEQAKSKDTKLKMTEERYKRRIEELMSENGELKQEIKMLESERISTLLPTSTVSSRNTPSPVTSRKSMQRVILGPANSNSPVSTSLTNSSIRPKSWSTSLSNAARSSSTPPLKHQMTHTTPNTNTTALNPTLDSDSSLNTSIKSKRTQLGFTKSLSSPSMNASVRRRSAIPTMTPTATNRDLTSDTIDTASSLSSGDFTHDTQVLSYWQDYFMEVERISCLGTPIIDKQLRDGVRERRYADGTRVILYKNGTTKEYKTTGDEITRYTNDDVKELNPAGVITYYFSERGVTQIKYPSGLEVTHFSDRQTEKRYPDGKVEIVFPNQSQRYIHPDGKKEDFYPDGTYEVSESNGRKRVFHSNGSKEEWFADRKEKLMPSGEIKIVYADGRKVKRLPDGRQKVTDSSGHVIHNDIGE